MVAKGGTCGEEVAEIDRIERARETLAGIRANGNDGRLVAGDKLWRDRLDGMLPPSHVNLSEIDDVVMAKPQRGRRKERANVGNHRDRRILDGVLTKKMIAESAPLALLVWRANGLAPRPKALGQLLGRSEVTVEAPPLWAVQHEHGVKAPNVADHRPGARGVRFETAVSSPGSVHLLCSALFGSRSFEGDVSKGHNQR
jgi:hypothetical protein